MKKINGAIITDVNSEYSLNLDAMKMKFGGYRELLMIGKIDVTIKSTVTTNIIEEMLTKVGYSSKWNTKVERTGIFSYAQWSEEEKLKDKEVISVKYKSFTFEKKISVELGEDNPIVILCDPKIVNSIIRDRNEYDYWRRGSVENRISQVSDCDYVKQILNKLDVKYDILKDEEVVF